PPLLGDVSLPPLARLQVLQKKWEEFKNLDYIFERKERLDQQMWRQFRIDVPRTRPSATQWMEPETHQVSRANELYVWATRHSASGCVQGIPDLATPYYEIFLSSDIGTSSYCTCASPKLLLTFPSVSSSRLFDGIQDNYISPQPGIHRGWGVGVDKLGELVKRIDDLFHPSIS
ncbi:hypothetical protein BDV93DRAFT_449205, partial [Ceratobasidium sp. AG-I]